MPDARPPANHLDTLAEHYRQGKSAFWLLSQTHLRLQASRDGGAPRPLGQPEWQEWLRWWDLLRFCLGLQSIAIWLRDEPQALQRIQALAHLAGQDALADILSEALQGQPQAAQTVQFHTLGEAEQRYTLTAPAHERFDGKDWSGTDIAIEQHCDGFAVVIAELMLAERAQLHLPGDQPAARPTAPPQPAAETLARLLRTESRLFATEIFGVAASPTAMRELPMQHQTTPAAEASLLEFFQHLHGPVAAPLLATHALHNGARLFCHGAQHGLELLPVEDWALQQQGSGGGPADAADADSLADALRFARGGCDDEYWVLATAGPLAGAVLLSETDGPQAHRRFASVDAFFDALLHAPLSVLNASGQLRYPLDGRWLELRPAPPA
ncbi:hypothetical protein D8I35_01210 [Corticibacter populi]|uniref:SMI1/KNR4 family protein n=1 Tax=Corticibacter populi TaxID=1550736 RepID=A0A3M6QY33_9BURK|nr:hypothetical protein [Corticibacter populi]RMX07783.1 hypothetical protein D8I35_01210 [Corticibacter populi]RZS35007.1 hypothetical protein EV687_0060 [Corticibacter populi]